MSLGCDIDYINAQHLHTLTEKTMFDSYEIMTLGFRMRGRNWFSEWNRHNCHVVGVLVLLIALREYGISSWTRIAGGHRIEMEAAAC